MAVALAVGAATLGAVTLLLDPGRVVEIIVVVIQVALAAVAGAAVAVERRRRP